MTILHKKIQNIGFFASFPQDRYFFMGLEICEQGKNNFFSHFYTEKLVFTFQDTYTSPNRFLHAKVSFAGDSYIYPKFFKNFEDFSNSHKIF